MDFDLDETEKRLKDEAAGALEGEAFEETRAAAVKRVSSRLARTSYAGVLLDPAALASNAYPRAAAFAAAGEEIARVSPGLFTALAVSLNLFGRMVARFGGKEQRERMLHRLFEGNMVGCVALHEHAGNFDAGVFELRGSRDGDGCRLSGRKRHVLLAPIADMAAVVGTLNGGEALFLVDPGADGVRIEGGMDTSRLAFPPAADIELGGCLVKDGDIIRCPGGERMSAEIQVMENLILSTAALGVMHRSFGAARRFADVRPEGRKPAMGYQENRFKIAEMYTLLRTSRFLVHRAAWMLQEDRPGAVAVVSCAKVFATESAERVASEALNVMGREGPASANDAEAGFRTSKFIQAWGRGCEALRMDIADDCLGSA